MRTNVPLANWPTYLGMKLNQPITTPFSKDKNPQASPLHASIKYYLPNFKLIKDLDIFQVKLLTKSTETCAKIYTIKYISLNSSLHIFFSSYKSVTINVHVVFYKLDQSLKCLVSVKANMQSI